MERDLNISVSAATIVKIAVVVALIYLIFLFRDIVLILLTSVVLASAIEPLARFFIRYRLPRVLAVILIYLLAFFAFAVLLYAFVPLILDDLIRLFSTLPERFSKISILSPDFGSSSLAAERVRSYFLEQVSAPDILASAKAAITELGGGVASAAGRLFGGVFSFVLTIVFSFYLAVQEKGIANFLRLAAPVRHEEYILDLWNRSQRKIGLWMQGQLLLALLIGVFVYLGLMIFGVPYALLLAILAAVFELIPIFGPILAAVPAIIIAFTQSTALGLITIALYVIIQQFENHLIYPLVVRKIVGVPPLVVIIAMLVGAKLAGIVGILLSVPAAAALMEYVNDVERKKFTPPV